jgi:hypothetical protein
MLTTKTVQYRTEQYSDLQGDSPAINKIKKK